MLMVMLCAARGCGRWWAVISRGIASRWGCVCLLERRICIHVCVCLCARVGTGKEIGVMRRFACEDSAAWQVFNPQFLLPPAPQTHTHSHTLALQRVTICHKHSGGTLRGFFGLEAPSDFPTSLSYSPLLLEQPSSIMPGDEMINKT